MIHQSPPLLVNMEELMAIEKVEANDDLLTAILIRLPPKSIFKFRSASKRWNDIIIDSFFLQSYSDIRKKEQHNSRDQLLTFILARLPSVIPSMDMVLKQVPKSFGKIVNYSNGLILFGHNSEFGYCSTVDLCILNPITGKSIELPPASLDDAIIGLVCEENTNELTPNYRVVAAHFIPFEQMDNTLPIETYSSKTGKWKKSTLIGTGKFRVYNRLLIFNGVFLWDADQHLAVYDSNNGDGNHVQLIKLPSDQEMTWITKSTWLSSDGVLWFGMNCGRSKIMKYWMLPKGGRRDSYRRSTTIPNTEWILMHTISHDSLCRDITTTFQRSFTTMDQLFKVDLLVRWNPFVYVITVQGGKLIYVHDIESKSIDMEFISLSSYALSER